MSIHEKAVGIRGSAKVRKPEDLMVCEQLAMGISAAIFGAHFFCLLNQHYFFKANVPAVTGKSAIPAVNGRGVTDAGGMI